MVALALTATGAAADQTGLGPWNGEAARLAGTSALVTSAMAYIKAQAATLKDPAIRRETEDAAFNPDACIRSRAGLTPERKQQILDTLAAEGLIDPAEAGRIPAACWPACSPACVTTAPPALSRRSPMPLRRAACSAATIRNPAGLRCTSPST